MRFFATALRRYTRSPALLVLAFGTASFCTAAPKTWTISGTFTDGGTVNGTFVFDPDTDTFGTFSISVSGGNTAVFFPFTWTPTNAIAEGPFTGEGSQIAFLSYTTYTNNESYVLQFVPTTPLTDAGGGVSINTSSSYSGNCFDCDPFRAFASGSLSGAVSTPTPPTATPAPPALLLMLMGLACAGAYAAPDRLRQAFDRK